MTTLYTLGNPSHLAQAYPRPALPPANPLNHLHYFHSDTGLTLYRAGSPVAWIVAGFHHGQLDKQPRYCEFVDVAYHRKTHYGVNLETADFLNLTDALAFVETVCGGES